MESSTLDNRFLGINSNSLVRVGHRAGLYIITLNEGPIVIL